MERAADARAAERRKRAVLSRYSRTAKLSMNTRLKRHPLNRDFSASASALAFGGEIWTVVGPE